MKQLQPNAILPQNVLDTVQNALSHELFSTLVSQNSPYLSFIWLDVRRPILNNLCIAMINILRCALHVWRTIPASNSRISGSCGVMDMIRAYRMHLAQKELKKLRLEADKKMKAARIIQRYYRGYIGRKKRQRQRYQRAAVIIQVAPIVRRIRGYLARLHYQNMRQNFMQNNIT
uniref:Myosin motor domain-containing protein n=1 Tax=Elaeophora elaphi TaxID=1147741 RepID=A0A0R3RFP2_9BILA